MIDDVLFNGGMQIPTRGVGIKSSVVDSNYHLILTYDDGKVADAGYVRGDVGKGISSITLLGTVGKVKTYRITYTDGTYYDFNVTDGADVKRYIAEYDVTDYEDILAAYRDGQTLYVSAEVGGSSALFPLLSPAEILPEGHPTFVFAAAAANNYEVFSVGYESPWTHNEMELQQKLISGTNIKTINGTSVLGSGDIDTTVQSDYEQNDEDAADYIKNRPFYETGMQSHIDRDYADPDSLISNTIAFNLNRDGDGYYIKNQTTFELTYDLTFDGSLYRGTVTQSNLENETATIGIYGCTRVSGTLIIAIPVNATGIQWIKELSGGGLDVELYSVCIITNNIYQSGSFTLNVESTAHELKTLDGKFLVLKTINGNTIKGTGDIELPDKQYVDDGLAEKQDTLVSGTNIKTLNGQSLLGSGNIVIESDAPITPVVNLPEPTQTEFNKHLNYLHENKTKFLVAENADTISQIDTITPSLAGLSGHNKVYRADNYIYYVSGGRGSDGLLRVYLERYDIVSKTVTRIKTLINGEGGYGYSTPSLLSFVMVNENTFIVSNNADAGSGAARIRKYDKINDTVTSIADWYNSAAYYPYVYDLIAYDNKVI